MIIIERNQNWEINITKTAKLFDKRWRDWKKWNSRIIETFEILEGRKLIKEIGQKNKKQTFLGLTLALRVLNGYDPVLSYHVFKLYEQDLLTKSKEKITELENYRKKLEIANARIAKLENKPPAVSFFLYTVIPCTVFMFADRVFFFGILLSINSRWLQNCCCS